MANLIQIKRSSTNATPVALQPAELAYSLLNTSNSLFIGDASNNVIRIGGGKYQWLHQANVSAPGTLTANAVVVTNGNGYVTEVRTNKLIVGADGTTINIASVNTFSNSSVLGSSSNTELATSYAVQFHVLEKTSALANAVVNTHIVFSNNGVFAGNSAFTYSLANNTVRATGNVEILGNVNGNTNLNITGTANVGGTLGTGNTTVTGFINVTGTANVGGIVGVGNTTVTGFINVSSYGTFGGNINAASMNLTGSANVTNTLNVGPDVNVNTTSIVVGNTTVNTNITASQVLLKGPAAVIDLGNTTVNTVINSVGVTTTGIVNATGSIATASTLSAGNTTVNGFLTVNSYANFGGVVNTAGLNVSGDVGITGNLTVSGTLTTINSVDLTISDPMVRVALGNDASDTLDVGIFGSFGNATATQYTGLFRDQTDGVYKLFAGVIPAPTTTVDTANGGFALANLSVNGFNANVVTTANVQITGGSISGIADLAVPDGGTGVSLFANNGVIYGQNTSALAVTSAGVEGDVLQAGPGGVPQFATLDGGTF